MIHSFKDVVTRQNRIEEENFSGTSTLTGTGTGTGTGLIGHEFNWARSINPCYRIEEENFSGTGTLTGTSLIGQEALTPASSISEIKRF